MKKILVWLLLLVCLTGCSLIRKDDDSDKDDKDDVGDITIVEKTNLVYNENISSEKINCDYKPMLLFEADNYKVYSYCVDNIKINNERLNRNNLQSFIYELDKIDEDNKLMFKDGGTILYKGTSMNVLKCNTILDFSLSNNDIYIGDSEMDYKINFCKPNNETEVKRFTVEEVGVDYLVVSRENEKDKVPYYFNKVLDVGKEYDFEMMFPEDLIIEDKISEIFSLGTIVEIREVE